MLKRFIFLVLILKMIFSCNFVEITLAVFAQPYKMQSMSVSIPQLFDMRALRWNRQQAAASFDKFLS